MKVWVCVNFTGPDRERYFQGTEVEIPDDEAISLLRYGIVSATPPAGVIV